MKTMVFEKNTDSLMTINAVTYRDTGSIIILECEKAVKLLHVWDGSH